MAFIELPQEFVTVIGPAMAMDTHWIDVRLRDGRVLRGLVVRNNQVITGHESDENGEGPLDFAGDDIVAFRRMRRWLPGGWTYREPR